MLRSSRSPILGLSFVLDAPLLSLNIQKQYHHHRIDDWARAYGSTPVSEQLRTYPSLTQQKFNWWQTGINVGLGEG